MRTTTCASTTPTVSRPPAGDRRATTTSRRSWSRTADAVNPLTVNGRTITEPAFVGPNDVVQFGATAVALRVFSRSSDTERDQLGQVPFRRTPYKPVRRPRADVQAARRASRPGRRRRGSRCSRRGMPMVDGPGHVRHHQDADDVDDDRADAGDGGRQPGRQPQDRQGRSSTIRSPTSHARIDKRQRRGRRRRCSTSGPSASTSRPTSPTSPAGRRCARSTCGRASGATTSSSAPGSGSAPCASQGHGRAGDVRRGRTCATPSTPPLAGYDRLPACRSASTSPSSACSACTASRSDVRRDVLVGADPGGHAAQPRGPRASSCIEGATRASARGRSGCRTPARPRRPSPAPTSPTTAEAAADLLRQLVVGRPDCAPAPTTRADHRWPWILVVLDESADVDPALASQLLELCPAAGISVVGGRRARRPRPATGQGDVPLRAVASGGALSSVWFTEPEDRRRGVRARAGERPADRPGGDVARPAARRHLGQRHDGDPAGRAAAVAVRPGTADAAVGRRAPGRRPSRTGCGRRSASAPPARSSSTSSSTDRTR